VNPGTFATATRMVIPAELDGGEDLRDRETVELVRKVREMVVLVVLVVLVTKRMGSGIPVIPSAGRSEMVGRKDSPEGVRCGGGGGWSAASSVGVRDPLEAGGELHEARVGRKECDGGGGTLLPPRPITDSATVLIAPTC
jgi:hypothetical protein